MTLSRKEKEKLGQGGGADGEAVKALIEREDHQKEEGKVERISTVADAHGKGESVEIPKA